jgi:hypothetical protein
MTMSEFELRMAMSARQTKRGNGRQTLQVRVTQRRTTVGKVEVYALKSVAVILGCPCLHKPGAGGWGSPQTGVLLDSEARDSGFVVVEIAERVEENAELV